MISYFKNEEYAFNTGEQAKGARLIDGACLSTDTKPTTGIANGSCLIEMDTGDRFMFDEAGSQWLNITNPGGGGEPEVWLTGDEYEDTGRGTRQFALNNVGEVDHVAELFNNAENYTVYLNGVELPYYSENPYKMWIDEENPASATLSVMLQNEETSMAIYMNASTAPTSVEVSVAAK